ncbi:permease [Pseudomonadota bacterium]
MVKKTKSKAKKIHNCKLEVTCDVHSSHDHKCCNSKGKRDNLLYFSVIAISIAYLSYMTIGDGIIGKTYIFNEYVFNTMNKMWIGIFAGVLFSGILGIVPQDFIVAAFGDRKSGIRGIVKASIAGVLLDLCSHGILIVAMQLYRRGLSLGQVMAFLIASPWNSLSLTFILWALVGLKWTLVFIFTSLLIAIISGLIFDKLVAKNKLPKNPNVLNLHKDFKFWEEFFYHIKEFRPTPKFALNAIMKGVKESRMVLKWVFMGVLISSVMRTFIPLEMFEVVFGPTFVGLMLTVVFATILEVCSEGSVPIAAEILTTAKAPGNSFAFLMVGVATDYTEIMGIKETTRSWKIALFLPLITLPQVLIIAMLMQ